MFSVHLTAGIRRGGDLPDAPYSDVPRQGNPTQHNPCRPASAGTPTCCVEAALIVVHQLPLHPGGASAKATVDRGKLPSTSGAGLQTSDLRVEILPLDASG